jgi:hypothetical protein
MLELREWASAIDLHSKPWLILGKGPTFARHIDFDLAAFHTISLNHAVRALTVDVAHMIDVDVAADCADALRENCRWLLMPRHPHVRFDPTGRRLEDFFDEIPILRELDEQGRLVWYNLSSARPVGNSPVIRARFFSAEAAIGVLAAVGVKEVRSLGVDGGRGYSKAFAELEATTMLANTRVSFDQQFVEIERIVRENGMEYAPLVPGQEPIRVFVGADESQLVAAAVLEYSIRKHASRRVEFTTMIDLSVPMPKDPENRPRTGFSFYRFMIPKLAGYQGRAIYCDCDMQVFADMTELMEIPFDEHTVLCTNQPAPPPKWEGNPNFKPGRHLAVMVLDCERLRWDVDEIVRGLDNGRYDYKQLMSDLVIVPEEQIAEKVPVEWNSLEYFEPGKTKLIHYTVVPTQPWKTDDNPYRELWEAEFREALAAHAIDPDLVRRSVAAGHVKPSLLSMLDGGTGNGGPSGVRAHRLRYTMWRAAVRARERLRSLARR